MKASVKGKKKRSTEKAPSSSYLQYVFDAQASSEFH